MSQIKNIEKIPEEVRELTELGLGEALKKGSLGKMKINFIQIENSLSGGKTGAVVFVARYGVKDKTTFVRVLKIAAKEICESENEGYVKTRETLLDIFSQVEYYTEDEFVSDKNDYGILLYQDVGTVAASDLKGIAKYFTNKILKADNEHKPEIKEETEKFSRELSLLMQKEVFLGLKKGLYGNVKRKDVNLSDYYGKKLISDKVKLGLAELKIIEPTLPDRATILEYFNINATYHEVNYVHGDLNPENVLVWENERGFLSCKLIDFGEVIPKKKDNFTPLFWDYSRLLGEMILNFVEEMMNQPTDREDARRASLRDENGRPSDNSNPFSQKEQINQILNDFYLVVEAFFKNDPSKLENANPKIEYISRIYLSTLFDFINEAKSGLKDLRRAEVMQDYFYCQILFFLFFAKFQRENPYKRLFGVKFALKLYEFANSGEAGLQSLILSLEKFYFEFSSSQAKNKQPQIGPTIGARSPFMGLSYFQEKDKEFFFGREKFTEELLKAIEEKPIVALAGASGSGKSSVVHAGVIPKLREQGYLIFKFRPGVNPYMAAMNALRNTNTNTIELHTDARRASSEAVGRSSESSELGRSQLEVGRAAHVPTGIDLIELIRNILKSNPGKRLFLLGDQFEELFTLCTDARQREDLGSALIDAAKEFKDRFRFFITIRSDFWTKLLEDAGFSSVVGDSGEHKALGERFFLSPMTIEELRSTIEKPLAVSKLFIQDGLTDLILTSVSRDSGSLPLLEFCLQELWKKQVDLTLTYNAYKEIGEVKGALASYADEVFSKLINKDKELSNKIFIQLVQPGEGTEDTRRLAIKKDFSHIGDSDKIWNLIQRLANDRLIVTGIQAETNEETVEVVHEALIREWGILKDWMEEDRKFRIWQEELRRELKKWESNNKSEINLLKGLMLIESEDWLDKNNSDINKQEQEFISLSAQSREKELEKKQKANSISTRFQLIFAGMALILLGIIGVTGFTYYKNSIAILSLTEDLIDQINNRVIQKTTSYLFTAVDMTELSSKVAGEGANSILENQGLNSLMINILILHPQLTMFNIGNERGDFLMQRRWTDATIATKTIDRSKKDKDPKVTWKYRDQSGKIIKEEIVKEDYDPRKRPWYIGAKEKEGLFWSDVYIFNTGKIPGITASAPVHDASGNLMGIFGLDIPLIEISNFLEDLRKEIQDKKFGKTAIAFIVNTKGDLVAYPDITQPMIKEPDGNFRSRKITELEVNPPIVQDSYKYFSETKDTKFTFETGGKRYIASYKKFPDTFEKDWTVGLVVPEDDYIGAIKETNDLLLTVTVITMFIFGILVFILNSLQKTLTGLIVTKGKNQKV